MSPRDSSPPKSSPRSDPPGTLPVSWLMAVVVAGPLAEPYVMLTLPPSVDSVGSGDPSVGSSHCWPVTMSPKPSPFTSPMSVMTPGFSVCADETTRPDALPGM